jgi:arsenate reductase
MRISLFYIFYIYSIYYLEKLYKYLAQSCSEQKKMKKVLFVCVGNAARSIMAEALFNAAAPEGWKAQSGGTKPASRISEDAVSVLREIGVEVEKEKPTPIDNGLAKSAEIGITMGCGVEDECPVLFTPVKEDWEINDPRGEPIEKYRELRDEIKRRVDELIKKIEEEGI